HWLSAPRDSRRELLLARPHPRRTPAPLPRTAHRARTKPFELASNWAGRTAHPAFAPHAAAVALRAAANPTTPAERRSSDATRAARARGNPPVPPTDRRTTRRSAST